MILLTKNTSQDIPFYLSPSALPTYSIKVINKTTHKEDTIALTDISTSDVLQVFNFADVALLANNTYDYYIYDGNTVLEVGLLEILGVGDCALPNITYADTDTDIVYYDCTNT